MTSEQKNSDPAGSFTCNGDNQQAKRSSGGLTTTYAYDGKGTLVRKSTSGGTWTIYIGGVYEKHQDGRYGERRVRGGHGGQEARRPVVAPGVHR